MSRSTATLLLAAVLGYACTEPPTDETPKGAVTLFLSAMNRTERDPEARREAYALLSESSREALQERARRANSLGAREFQPWEMIVPGRFRTVVAPAPGAAGMRERIEGSRATVTVVNAAGTRRVPVPLVREHGRWRLALEVPRSEPP